MKRVSGMEKSSNLFFIFEKAPDNLSEAFKIYKIMFKFIFTAYCAIIISVTGFPKFLRNRG